MAGISQEMIKQAEDAEKAEAKNYLDKVAEKLKGLGMPVNTKLLYGKAADTIVNYIGKEDFDLAIISTHGRSGISRWIWGSVADRIIRYVCIPVMMVRAPGCGLLMKEK
jgi:nucleotide-binding universal stress UspA family protein